VFGENGEELILNITFFCKGVEDVPTAQKAKKPSVVKKQEMLLKCLLTDDELLDCGQKMATANTTKAILEREFESVKANYKAKVAEQDAIVQKNSSLISLKSEYRNVNVVVTKDYETEMYTAIRQDTGEVIETRKMTEHELSELPLDDEQKGDVQ
jgi:hypothetical protein